MAGGKSDSAFKCLNDIATRDDLLGFQPYVKAIADFLTDEDTSAPLTLSIEGEWGCGKSSFMKQLKKEINEKNKAKEETKYFTVWFNSWKYEKEDELWASFALNFMDELSKQLSWKRLQYARLQLFYLRYKLKFGSGFLAIIHLLWSVLSFILVSSFLFLIITYVLGYLGMPLPGFLVGDIFKNFANFVLISAPFVGLMNYFSTETWFIDVFRDPFGLKKLDSNMNYKERISFREHFHSDFNEIIKSYVGDSKVYVFIDDLDRCEVPKAAELMQAINLMISDDSKVYFSLGMDRKVISAGLASKNEKVVRLLDIDGLEYGYNFIEKFVQLPFKVPSPKSDNFLHLLTAFDESKSTSKISEPVGKSGISETSNPDKSPGGCIKSSLSKNNGQDTGTDDSNNVVTESNEQEIQNDKDCVEDEKTLKLILEMVVPALDNNPRRIKQFINQFRFQKIIGKNTGLFRYDKDTAPEYMWNCKKLAKFVAISIKWNSLISALNSDRTILDRLQEYALKPENEDKNLEKWIKDEGLIRLLRHGCLEGDDLSQKSEYALSGLDFSKLLQISPIIYPDIGKFGKVDRDFVLIHAGNFMMGSNEYDDEKPVHSVKIRKPFYLGKFPVTQKQWEKVMGSNPSSFRGDDLPVESVSWDDVQEFIKKLNEMEGTDKYRLPSEAEWEYACRAGTTTRFYFGDDESKLEDYAWFTDNSGSKTHPVGQKKPNSFGLYDMHGNVWEWCQDRWHDNYNGAPSDGSSWEDENSSSRVFRGGSWDCHARSCRSAFRIRADPGIRNLVVGFRLLRKL